MGSHHQVSAQRLHFVLVLLLVLLNSVHGFSGGGNYSSNPFTVTASQEFPLTLIQEVSTEVEFIFSLNESSELANENAGLEKGEFQVLAVVEDSILHIIGDSKLFFFSNQSTNISLILEGTLPGRTNLRLVLSDISSPGNGMGEDYFFKVLVEREERPIDIAFNAVVILLVACANIGMGSKVDLNVVKAEMRRPIAPIIGLCSQFLFMPLVAFVIAYNIDLDPGIALGFFALGCSPGGSASNAYTHLLEGNVSLSVTMTLISTLAALGFLPMWLFSLGQLIFKEGDIKIPFENIIFSLIGILVPVVMGLLLQRFYPRMAAFCVKAVKYIMAVFIVFVLTVGVYANIYIFQLVSGEVVLAAILLPYLGFLFGGILACVLRQKKENVIAIAVETGIQNTGLPIILLRLSLTGPEKDTGIVSPVISALFTPIPLIIGVIYVQVKKRLFKREEQLEVMQTEDEGHAVYKKKQETIVSDVSGDGFLLKDEDL